MVVFDEKNHIYYVNGKQVPSVTQILHYLFPNKYKGVSSEVLNNKANYGTEVHNLLEYVNSINITNPSDAYSLKCSDPMMINSIVSYINLKNKFRFRPLKQELIVNNDYVAGKFDLLAEMNNKICLMDYKTTYKLDKEYLSWQLSIYNYLNKNEKAEELYAIWVPKSSEVQMFEIDFKTNDEIENLIKEYYANEKGEEVTL